MPKKKRRGRRLLIAGFIVVFAVCLGIAAVFYDTAMLYYRLRGTFELHRVRNDQGYAEFRHRETGVVFVALAGGRFPMGAPEDELGSRDSERPVHDVVLSPFLIAKYELSQREWRSVMGSNPSLFTGNGFPVEWVSHEECVEFCSKVGFQLPTEAQWEFACRGGSRTAFAFGSTLSYSDANFGGTNSDESAAAEFSRGRTAPVDSFRANGFGIHNMHGNVWEWCADRFDASFYASARATAQDPVCTGSGSFVVRGGTWSQDAPSCRSAHRESRPPHYRNVSVGFRPVFNLDTSAPRP